jgi:small neutral amino acid transporter SnatA (MarC family)
MVITESLGGPIPTLVVVLANALVSYAILSNYQVILSKLGKPVAIMTAKISNLIVAALAVSLVRRGIEEFLAFG